MPATRTTMRCWRPPTCASGHRSFGRRRSATSTPSRATSQAMWARRGGDDPGALVHPADLLLHERLGDPRAGDPIHAPRGCDELDFELEVAAIVDAPASDLAAERAEEVIGGYTIFDDLSASDLQRDGDGPPPRAGQGQGLRELVRPVPRDARRARRWRHGTRLRPRDDGRGQRRRDRPWDLVGRPAQDGRRACDRSPWLSPLVGERNGPARSGPQHGEAMPRRSARLSRETTGDGES